LLKCGARFRLRYQQTIVKIALVAAAIGPILVVVGKLSSRGRHDYDDHTAGFLLLSAVVKGAMAALNADHAGKSYRPNHYAAIAACW
jgi:hypothetical protein